MTRISGLARGSALMAALWLGVATTAKAGTIVYDTSGLIGSAGVTGTNAVSFVPVASNSFSAPSTLSLGNFLVAALPTGQTTTYNHTPFSLSFIVKTVDGINVAAAPPIVTLSGFLNGSITGAGLSSVIAQFDSLPKGGAKIQIGPDYFINLTLPSPQRILVPSSSAGGMSTAEAYVSLFHETPEPAAVAMFLVAGAGLGWRGLRRSRSIRRGS